MEYKVNIDNFDRNQWEQNAKEFADYTIYQTWPYQQVRGEMESQTVSRFSIENNYGQVTTMGQVRIKSFKPFGLKIGYIQSGPLVRGIGGISMFDSNLWKSLRAAYIGRKVNILRIVPNICDEEDGKELVRLLKYSGFEKNSNIAPYHTILVSLKEPEDEILARIHRDNRRILRKVEKMELEVKQGTNEKFFGILESLYVGAKKRKGFKGLDPKTFARTQDMLAPNEKAIVLVAYFNGQPVTAHATTLFGNTAVPILTASNEIGLRYHISYLLWWKAYLIAKSFGLEYCDLGGINPKKNPNGYLFKRRMGGSEKFHIGVFDTYQNSFVKTIWKIAEKVYRSIKR